MSQHLPNSNYRRGSPSFIRLLTRVHPNPPGGLGWEGKLCRQGSRIPPEELPVPAVALECASCAQRGHMLWILWRYDFSSGEWREMARAQSADWSWAVALRPLALRLLHPEPIVVDCGKIAQRLTTSIDAELQELSQEYQGVLLSALDVHLDAHIALLL